MAAEKTRKKKIRQASFIAVGECTGCGGGTIVLMDEDEVVFAEAHYPIDDDGDDWLENVFIPSLRAAKASGKSTRH